MPMRGIVGVLVAAAMVACGATPTPQSRSSNALDGERSAAIRDSVRAFAASIAQGITARGPAAWREFFSGDSAFFMASEGQLVFASGAAATLGIESLTKAIAHLELQWGDPIRVDALAPGLAVLGMTYHESRADSAGRRTDEQGYFTGVAEHRGGAWRLRDAHWSVVPPPPAIP